VKLPHLLRRIALEANGSAIGMSSRLTVDWLTDAKRPTIVAIEQTGLAGLVLIPNGLTDAKDTENRVVKATRTFNVIGADHDVTEHLFSISLCAALRREAVSCEMVNLAT
jgi:hypothetical protein